MAVTTSNKVPEIYDFRDIIGEHLFIKVMDLGNISETEAQHVTGMLLNSENDQIYKMLEDNEILKSKVECSKRMIAEQQETCITSCTKNGLFEYEDTLCENLFEVVERICPDHASEITGMLLELGHSVCAQLLSKPEELNLAIEKAILTYNCDGRDESVDQESVAEAMYNFIEPLYPEHAAKLTGMLLELDQRELKPLLRNHSQLKKKIMYAYQTLMNSTDELTETK